MSPVSASHSAARGPVRRRWLRATAGLLLLSGLLRAGAASNEPGPLVPVTMLVGFTNTVFLQSNRNDVEAAFKALAETIGRKRGFQVTVKTRFFDNPAAFHQAIAAGEINFGVFDSLSFVAGRAGGLLTPVFVTTSAGSTGQRYLVLVRRDRGLHTLEDLRGKKIVELQAPNLSVGHTWLLSQLRANRVRSQEEFFGLIEHVARPAAAVLPVFFGTRDACLVDESGFRLMVELNPQVGLQLQPLATSVPLAGVVLCASETDWSAPAFRPVLLRTLGELHLEPAGRQILALFKIEQLVPFEEGQLETVRELWLSQKPPPQETGT